MSKILDKLDLKSKYDGSKLDIVDVNPGYGLFSTMLNYELKPRNHILIENKERCVTSLSSIINKLVEETGIIPILHYTKRIHLYGKLIMI